MRYGLDGQDRIESLPPPPQQEGGVSCAPKLEPWLAALDARRKRHQASREAVEQMDPGELDALYMTPEQVEAYAEFAEKNLILSNQIDLHEWRRVEPARRWAGFADFMQRMDGETIPRTGSATGAARPGANGATSSSKRTTGGCRGEPMGGTRVRSAQRLPSPHDPA